MNKTKFLKNQKILHLATVGKKGFPHIVPVWYIYDIGKIYVGTNTRTKKAKNLMKNSKVSFCVDVGLKSPKIYGVMGTGIGKLIHDEKKVRIIAKKILLRYFANLTNKSAKELLDDTNCVLEISPKEFSVWHY